MAWLKMESEGVGERHRKIKEMHKKDRKQAASIKIESGARL